MNSGLTQEELDERARRRVSVVRDALILSSTEAELAACSWIYSNLPASEIKYLFPVGIHYYVKELMEQMRYDFFVKPRKRNKKK